jgi:hypothetical protein
MAILLAACAALVGVLLYGWLHAGRIYAVSVVASQPFDGAPDLRKALAYRSGNTLLIRVQDYFHDTGKLRQPYLKITHEGAARLVLDVEGNWSPLSTKCEHQRRVEIRFELPHVVTTLEVHNANTGESIRAELNRTAAPAVAWPNREGEVGGC